ncbi:hypothetical protein AV530_014438 [Patagioenas fasciata monilis]|uniref:Dynein heavy chain tail domain-containing protein n=1 Tax=Patagioenas fasciata monilis TaxID=372326 RepID=A0A1V4KBY6_PATFA|nr:hypothetical protein AV530_014438 [Patagioenas fasciata monilis]
MLHEVMQKAISAMRKTTEGLGMENRKNLQFGKLSQTPLEHVVAFIEEEFEDDYTEFKAQILDPDRCPASVLCIGFHDCSGLESMFKLLAIFGSFLQKSVIVEIFSLNYNI